MPSGGRGRKFKSPHPDQLSAFQQFRAYALACGFVRSRSVVALIVATRQARAPFRSYVSSRMSVRSKSSNASWLQFRVGNSRSASYLQPGNHCSGVVNLTVIPQLPDLISQILVNHQCLDVDFQENVQRMACPLAECDLQFWAF